MKLLVMLAALLVTGCSVDVVHETENRAQTESLSTSDRSKTGVSVDFLNESTPPETKYTDSATSSIERSTTIMKVIVPETSPEVVNSTPPIVSRSEPTIQVTGSGNTVILGDIHHHHHKHLHFHETPKPTPVRIDVQVEFDDRIGERERRSRMVHQRIARFFPNYGN